MYRMLSLTSDKHVPISEAEVEVKITNTSNAQQGEHIRGQQRVFRLSPGMCFSCLFKHIRNMSGTHC